MNLLADLLISTTLLTLQPSQEPGAAAEVVMHNELTNGPQDDGAYSMTLDGQSFGVRFEWDAGAYGADRVVIIPPRGMTCEPFTCDMMVPEGQTAKVVLFWVLG